MKRKTTDRRKNNLLAVLCGLVGLCVYGYDWI